jgi:hypothetical protein
MNEELQISSCTMCIFGKEHVDFLTKTATKLVFTFPVPTNVRSVRDVAHKVCIPVGPEFQLSSKSIKMDVYVCVCVYVWA